MKKFLTVAAIAVTAATNFLISPANAQIPAPTHQWYSVAQSSDGSLASVDNGSMGRNGNLAGFWLQINYPDNSVRRMYTLANCSNSTYQALWMVHAQNGQIVQNGAVAEAPITVPPGSLGAMAFNYACNAQIDIVKLQLEALTRSRKINAEAINRAMQMGLGVFR